MELQFEQSAWECLRPVVSQPRNEEHTMEVRLPESMPDIGSVLAAWGQVLLRGKEWRGNSVGISGGVMAWVLYRSEDGDELQSVEAWIPFQTKWDVPQTDRDGTLCAACHLRNIDARTLSARKLMIRAGVSILPEVLEPVQLEFFRPNHVPKDVFLLTRNYPVRVYREAGEKSFALDEEISVPVTVGQVERLIRWEMMPEITDRKVMSGKVVFRGSVGVHMLFLDQEHKIKSWDFEVPFSQFEELQGEYGPEAEARIIAAVTGMELDVTDRLHLKAGLVGQYMIFERTILEIVADAYSNDRTVHPICREFPIPAILDDRAVTVKLEGKAECQGQRILDAAFMLEQPAVQQEETAKLRQRGSWQVLLENEEGHLFGQVLYGEHEEHFPADENCRVSADAVATGVHKTELLGGQLDAYSEILVDSQGVMDQGLTLVAGLELGEAVKPDPDRPSMILRRTGTDCLWDIAKANGSTVEAIRTANRLDGDPREGQMLLIPVL